MYDVIIVGARVAGSSTAMLLARKGHSVLLVDRASFPSDTLSTHQVQLPGIARLRHWGLLAAVVASGAPATRKVRFDAGPVVLQGHYPSFDGDALRDAELLAGAVDDGFAGRRPLEAALAGYQRERDRAVLPMYEFTTELAAFAPPTVEQQTLFAALAGRQEEIDRFLGVLTGAVPLPEYFTPRNLLRVLGARGMAAVLLGKLRRPQRPDPREGAEAQGSRLA